MYVLNINDSAEMKYKVAKIWLEDPSFLEAGAAEQIWNMCKLPFVFHHIAVMPDTHQGYGMPIGGVLATKDVIIPNAVGVDISCGVAYMKLGIKRAELQEHMLKILAEIRKVIPVGFNKREKPNNYFYFYMPQLPDNAVFDYTFSGAQSICSQEQKKSLFSMGTLGGGNHFIEFQVDAEDEVYIMIHSGSRNLGKKVADHYNNIAVELNEKYYSSVPKNYQLAFLPIDSIEAERYLAEMEYCVSFAKKNRYAMMQDIIAIVQNFEKVTNDPDIKDVTHNYVALENHFGKNVYVHRKGATRAREGDICIIPGSQGTASYICKGLGNVDSFHSCSHGAGRLMSRKRAKAELCLEDEVRSLEDQGILHSIRGAKNLDEAPSAYKDIDEVMANQTDLVQVTKKLSPFAVIKG